MVGQILLKDALMNRPSYYLIAENVLTRLRLETADGGYIDRAAYGARESIALEIIETAALTLGLPTERDEAANLVVTLEGSDSELPYLVCGSHLDSVPHGGNFDGAAGVVAALLALGNLREEGLRPRRSIKLFGLRGEESSRFGKPYLGSSALLGLLTAEDLAARASDNGRTLSDCMRDVGVAVERVQSGRPLLDPSKMACWLELHIEQGPVLAARQLPIGIVTGIRGNIRHRMIECIGEAGHSGAIPRELRHDPIFATAHLITRLDKHWRQFLEQGHDLVVTSGMFGTDPNEHAIAKIPGSVRFSFEVRSQEKDSLEQFYRLFRLECEMIGATNGVHFSFDRCIETAPATMDRAWVDRLKKIAVELNVPFLETPSGAGHDAAVFANVGIPTAMIFVRNENGSHNPQEFMDLDDLLLGAEILKRALWNAAS